MIQCKWSKNTPWVVFLNNLDQKGNDGLLKLLFTNNNRSFITGLSNDVANRLAALSKSPSKIGYGMTSGIFDNVSEHGKSNRENKKDVAYDAYRSVISGSLGVLKLAQEDMKMGFSRNLVHMVIPIIIVDGNLFESSLDNDGSVQVNSTDSSMVSYNGTHYSMVRIYNLSGFESAINAINSDIEIILTAVKGNGVKYAANTTIGIVNRI